MVVKNVIIISAIKKTANAIGVGQEVIAAEKGIKEGDAMVLLVDQVVINVC